MTDTRGGSSGRARDVGGPARHERPVLDGLGLDAARHADRLVLAATGAGVTRWATYLEPLPEHLRDDEPAALRRTAMRARAAYGPKDSIRDALPAELTEPFLEAVDRLLRELNRSRG